MPRIAPAIPLLGSGPHPSRREILLLVALAALLGLGLYLTPPNLYQTIDWVRIHELYKEYLVAAVWDGRLPLWNPHIALGRPFLADVDSAFFYPPHLLYLVLPARVAVMAVLCMHLGLALYGMLRLAASFGMPRTVGWGMGLVFVLSAPIVGSFHSGLIHYGAMLCYLPLTFHLVARLQAERSRKAIACLGLVLGLQLLGGHPHAVWLVALGSALFVLGRRLERPLAPSLVAAAVELGALALALLGAFCLAGVSMLPLAELTQQSNRQEASLAFAGTFSMPWYGWATFLVPTDAVFSFNANAQLFAGVLTFLAGAAGIAVVRSREMRAFAFLAVVAGLVAAGTSTALFAVLYRVVPGLAYLRAPSRASALVTFALVLAAGSFFAARPDERRAMAWLIALGAASLGAVLAFVLGSGRVTGPAYVWGWPLLVVVSSVALLAWLRAPSHRLRAATLLVVGLLALDLGMAAWGLKQQNLEQPDRPAERAISQWLAMQPPEPGKAPMRVSMPKPWVRENAGMRYGWSSFTGYASLHLGRVWNYLHAGLGLPVPSVLNTYPDGAIFARGPFPYDSMNLRLGMDPRTRMPTEQKHADPRVYLASEVDRVAGPAEAVQRMANGHDVHRAPLLEAGGSPPPVLGPASSSDQATMVEFLPEQLTIATSAQRPALLIVKEAWYPGWRAQVDGGETPCFPVNAWMRGVWLPAGEHRVVLTYRSRFLAAGGALSLVGLAVLLGLCCWRRK